MRFRKHFKAPVKKSLEKVLKAHLKKSGISNIDFCQYLTIAKYCVIEGHANIFSDTGIDEFLQSEFAARMNPTQKDKAKYVLQLLNNWKHQRKSEKCKGISVSCNYCGSLAELVDSKVVYGVSRGNIYICSNYPVCDAYVGVHKGDNWPLGTLANNELRMWRNKVHAIIDPIWKNHTTGRRIDKRKEVYAVLQQKMNLPYHKTHVASFNIKQCKQAISVIKECYGVQNSKQD